MNKLRGTSANIFGFLGVLTVLFEVAHMSRQLWIPTFFLCFLAIIIDLIPLRLGSTTFSFNSAIMILAILQYDMRVALIVGVVEVLLLGFVLKIKMAYISYNLGIMVSTTIISGLIWNWGLQCQDAYKVYFILSTLVIYMLLNSFFMAFAMCFFLGEKLWLGWVSFIREHYQVYLVTEIIGLMIASLIHRYGIGVLFIVTIFIILFYSLINKLYNSLKHERDTAESLKQATLSTVTMMAAAVDARDPYTHGHSTRVAIYSKRLAESIGLPANEVEDIYIAGVLHDLGKIGIQDSILNKAGRLTPEEMEEMKSHPVKGEEILKEWGEFDRILPAVRWHHERYDGKGYPDGLVGEETPLMARLLAVCDAFDAMTSDRPYRKGMPIEKALSIIDTEKGIQFDPHLAESFIVMINRLDANELIEILKTERQQKLIGIK